MQTVVEELPENRVRLAVEVPSGDVQHAIDHAASDLASSLKIPGFRKGKVPMQVLLARVGKERLYTEAVDSHIGGWFRNAAVGDHIRPIAQPEYDYELPESGDEDFSLHGHRRRPAEARGGRLDDAGGAARTSPRSPRRWSISELEVLRDTAAELIPVEDRPAREGDTVVVDLVARRRGCSATTWSSSAPSGSIEEIESGSGRHVGRRDEGGFLRARRRADARGDASRS